MSYWLTHRLSERLKVMPLPAPFTADGLAQALGKRSQRSIELAGVGAGVAAVRPACDLKARTEDSGFISYRHHPAPNQDTSVHSQPVLKRTGPSDPATNGLLIRNGSGSGSL